ncbi:hypothetical protein Rhow_009037 [Rhodococcus wratislaviensis]|uniref:Uncharacterized protein n=1 Tax=Rhodococcus wratislaviensis TaxID=44752 RepID=A0A402CLK0_RHOWR|nr:hypothetical protein Rhow_009037 [Rhodococcus wratislaviensis]
MNYVERGPDTRSSGVHDQHRPGMEQFQPIVPRLQSQLGTQVRATQHQSDHPRVLGNLVRPSQPK